MIEWITVALMVAGTAFVLVSSIGLLRLPDFYTRLHGPTKASTLGLICILLASAIFFTNELHFLRVRELLAIAFLFLTAPVSAHMLGKAGRAIGTAFHKDTHIES